MPALKHRVPRYCLHQRSGQARVRINGQEYWLGRYGSVESRRRYDELIAKYLARRQQRDVGITVSQVVSLFWRHAKLRYGDSGKGKWGAAVNWRPILRMLRQRYGKEPARDFGPRKLQAILDEMPALGWSRTYCNQQLARTKRMFKWAVRQEYVPAEVYAALCSVEGLRKGAAVVRETPAVKPVADDLVDATLPLLPPVVADMVKLQRLAGARPGEVTILRPCDLDRSGDVWIYTPESHKTEHHDKDRHIYIGPEGQALLRPYLLRGDEDYCFAPRWKRSGKHYTTDSYRRAVHRACERAGIEKWSPNQLRHSAGTEIRREFGIETASAVLGHSNLSTTQIYAEADRKRAMEAARRLG